MKVFVTGATGFVTGTVAMHLLARSQGVATLANTFHDEKFIKQEVKQMCDWLGSCTESAARNAHDEHGTGERVRR